jgi:hypothetical protein
VAPAEGSPSVDSGAGTFIAGALTWVTIAITPGDCSAAAVSIRSMTPFAMVLKTIAPCTRPSTGYSAEKRAAPVTFSTPSSRSIGWPR